MKAAPVPRTSCSFGAKSNAWSLTITPTYQYKAVGSSAAKPPITAVGDGAAGLLFGTSGTAKDQIRGLIETGVLF
ncbi:MAG: hypothetical protein WDN45_09330 [Caulobacteraceae bacterium]